MGNENINERIVKGIGDFNSLCFQMIQNIKEKREVARWCQSTRNGNERKELGRGTANLFY